MALKHIHLGDGRASQVLFNHELSCTDDYSTVIATGEQAYDEGVHAHPKPKRGITGGGDHHLINRVGANPGDLQVMAAQLQDALPSIGIPQTRSPIPRSTGDLRAVLHPSSRTDDALVAHQSYLSHGEHVR